MRPAVQFKDNWHIGAICEHLQAVSEGQITRLIINVPFRTAKSTICSVAWPAWEWIHRPTIKWLCGSYAEKLAIRDNLAMRRLIQSNWYQERWGRGYNLTDNSDWGDPDGFELTGDQNQKVRFENDRSGYRIAFGASSGVMGDGGDRVLIDDWHDRQGAHSDKEREASLVTFDEAVFTRLNDPIVDPIVIVMQRLHENDLSGHLLAAGGYQHLLIPMRYEPERSKVTVIGWKDPRKVAGELMHPARFPEAYVADIERKNPYMAAGQLQQRPAPSEGGILKRAWWQFWDDLPAKFDEEIQSWDLGGRIVDTHRSKSSRGSGSDSANYTAGQAWGRVGANCYMKPEQVYAQLDFAREVEKILDFSNRHRGAILIENKANGPSVIATLKDKIPGVTPVNPDGDKTARAQAVSPYIASGNVWLPNPYDAQGNPRADREWVLLFIENCASFPNGSNPPGSHGDDVDAMTQAIHHLLHARGEAGTAIEFLRLRAAKIFENEHAERHRNKQTECPGTECQIITEIMKERGLAA